MFGVDGGAWRGAIEGVEFIILQGGGLGDVGEGQRTRDLRKPMDEALYTIEDLCEVVRIWLWMWVWMFVFCLFVEVFV